MLCRACYRKVERSTIRGGKKEWTRRFERYADTLPPEARARYLDSSPDPNWVLVHKMWARSPRPAVGHNMIGFVYADGDSVGRFIESSAHVREYRAKSLA